MTTRRSVDLDVPQLLRPVEEQSSPWLRRFPIVIDPEAVAEMSRRQDERAQEKVVARHTRRAGRRKAVPGNRR